MEIILRQDVDKVGKAGSVVKVKDGFARNFLIPNGLAMPLTPANLKRLEQEKQRRLWQLKKLKQEAEELKERLDNFSLTIPALVKNDDELYGSISAIDITAALKEEGFNIEKNSIVISEPIRSLGIYEVQINLHPEVKSKIKVWVVKK
ncbi:MAG: 50S ribosomal protein L9 [Candidatus Omnitrophica bacterium]|nr:50S ribosomal protein L9 [Candidatus Omnitrophota bacterium]